MSDSNDDCGSYSENEIGGQAEETRATKRRRRRSRSHDSGKLHWMPAVGFQDWLEATGLHVHSGGGGDLTPQIDRFWLIIFDTVCLLLCVIGPFCSKVMDMDLFKFYWEKILPKAVGAKKFNEEKKYFGTPCSMHIIIVFTT